MIQILAGFVTLAMLMYLRQFKEINIMLTRFLFILLFSFQTFAAYQPVTTVSGSVNVNNGVLSPVPVNIVSGTINVSTAGLATEVTLSSIDTSNADILASSQNIEAGQVTANSYLSSIQTNTLNAYNKLNAVVSSTEIRSFITNQPVSYPVTGTFWQSIQPVSLTGLTVVSGTIGITPNQTILSAQSGTWGSSLTGVSTTAALTVNQGTSPWVNSISNQPFVSIGAVSTTGVLSVSTTGAIPTFFQTAQGVAINGVSTTGALNVANATATSLKAQAESYQGGVAVGSANPLFIGIGSVSTTGYLNVSGTPLSILADSKVAQGSTTSGQKGSLTLGAITTENPAYTTAQSSPLSLLTNGYLRTSSVISGTPTVGFSTGSGVNINGVSTTSALSVAQSGIFAASISGVSTTTALNVAQSGIFANSISGVSTTTALNVAQSGIFANSISGVSTTGILNVSGTVAINPNQTILSAQSGAWGASISGVSTTGILNVSGTVALNPNQSLLSILNDYTSTATVSAPQNANTTFVAKVSNAARKGLQIMNTTDASCWFAFGTSVTSTTATVLLLPLSGYYNMAKPIYTGQIQGICSANPTTGQVTVTEQ
jgi:hypothetical protein